MPTHRFSIARAAAVWSSIVVGLLGWNHSPRQSPARGPQTIVPGAIWPDDRGQHVQAHGGGIIKLGDTYYWFGEERCPGPGPQRCAT